MRERVLVGMAYATAGLWCVLLLVLALSGAHL